MNHSQTYSTEQVGQVPETTLHPLNSSQVWHHPSKYNFDYKVHRSLINRSYNKVINRLSELESKKENRTHEFYYTLGLTYHLIGNLNLAKKYYLMSFDLYDDQEVNYPELALRLIK